jgi:predicted ATPase/DNA-binding SARP family transcriptional activator
VPESGAAESSRALRITLLGGFEVRVGARAVAAGAWRLRHARSLVKLLALAPSHRLHCDQLLDLLWPSLEPAAAANGLYCALHAARRALEPGLARASASAYLRRHGDVLALHSTGALAIDVEEFESAASAARQAQTPAAYLAALELYAGELLPEDRYEQWAVGRRETLRTTHLGLLVDLAGLHQARGEHGAALEALQRVVDCEPAHEAAHLGLMRLYALDGQRRRAVRQYEHLRQALHDEAEAEPDADSRRLHEAILAGRFPPPSRAPAPPPARLEAGQARAWGAPHNLPGQLTTFVGRRDELAQVADRLRGARLLTLTGPGGCGKTRLALQVGSAELAARDGAYPDGVWLVELAALAEPSLVAPAIASALAVQGAAGRPTRETLVAWLSRRRLLLILDNCEHLSGACAEVVATVLSACPGVRVLATSRTALGVPGELLWRVPPLSSPDPRRPPTVAALAVYDAPALFLERARLGRSGFELTPANAATVLALCDRLDGLPLAIELAAARLRVLTVEQIAERLADRFALLTGGSAAGPPRQRTLRATVEWSDALLAAPERLLFARLAVFAGGWTLEAAEAVCADQRIAVADVLDLLGRLADQSLISVEPDAGGGARYRMLETLREYGRERLAASGETGSIRRYHAAYYLALAEAAAPRLRGARQAAWLDRVEPERENMRAALGWFVECRQVEDGLRLGAALWRFWYVRGDLSEGRARLDELFAIVYSPEPTAARAQALHAAGHLAAEQGDYAPARALLEAALVMYEALADRLGKAEALGHRGDVAVFEGRLAEARPPLEQSLAIYREENDRSGLAQALHRLGKLAALEGGYRAARAMLEEAVAIYREVGDQWGVASCSVALGRLAQLQGAAPTARRLYDRGLAIGRSLGNKLLVALSLMRLADLSHSRGGHADARALNEEALAIYEEVGNRPAIGWVLLNLGRVARAQGDAAAARDFYERSLAISFELDRPDWSAGVFDRLAELALDAGDAAAARSLRDEGLAILRPSAGPTGRPLAHRR